MSTVECARCEREAPAITSRITFAGELGDEILGRVCADCWRAWMEAQIKVINEYRLHMGEASHREALANFARQFFRLDGGDGTLGPGPEGGLG